MLDRFRRKDTTFFAYFEEHARLTVVGTGELIALLVPGAKIAAHARRISDIEHEADQVTHRCVEALHKGSTTPINRDSVHRLITRQDDVMDFVEAAAERLALYGITETTDDARAMAKVLHEAAQKIEAAIKGLRVLAQDPQTILKHCVDINRLENEGDTILRRAVATLFKEVRDPIEVIKWKEIYEHLENATDRCEDVANVLEGVVLESRRSVWR